jgi:hypothetical protein
MPGNPAQLKGTKMKLYIFTALCAAATLAGMAAMIAQVVYA